MLRNSLFLQLRRRRMPLFILPVRVTGKLHNLRSVPLNKPCNHCNSYPAINLCYLYQPILCFQLHCPIQTPAGAHEVYRIS